MSSVGSRSFRFLGLFEVDESGRVLYTDVSESITDGSPSLRGANFFKEIADFVNAEDLERRFDSFLLMQSPACSFDFTCEYKDGPTDVRVLMARLQKEPCDYSFLIHIRPAEEATPPSERF